MIKVRDKMVNATKIDVSNWKMKKHYEWFKKYPLHTYAVTKKIDVTNIVSYAKTNKRSFFACFLYALVRGLNEIEEMRLRIIDGEVYLFDLIEPAYTVMTEQMVFDNCESPYVDDFDLFHHLTREAIDKVKKGIDEHRLFNNDDRFDQYYITCLPWIDFDALSHPIPSDESSFIPRICFGKYFLKEGRYYMSLNINVSHALVDGYPLSLAFLAIERQIENFETTVSK